MANLVFKASQRIKFEEFIKYYNDYGEVDENFITPNGYPLGKNLRNIRSGYVLSPEEKKQLHALGFRLVNNQFNFENFYKNYQQYGETGFSFVTPQGYPLGFQTYKIRKGIIILTAKQKKMLTDIGFNWKSRVRFDFDVFLSYFVEYGNVKSLFIADDGYPLGRLQLRIRAGTIKLNDEQIKLLTEKGFMWKFSELKEAENDSEF